MNGEQCTGGSICKDGICLCPEPTMFILSGVCVKENELHEFNEKLNNLDNIVNFFIIKKIIIF